MTRYQNPSNLTKTPRGETSASSKTQTTPAEVELNSGRTFSDITHDRGQNHHSVGQLCITSHNGRPTFKGDRVCAEQLELAERSFQSFEQAHANIDRINSLRTRNWERFFGKAAA